MQTGQILEWVFWPLSIVVSLLVWFSVFRKAGFSRYWGLLGLIPGLPIVIPIVLALVEWPSERELARLRVISGTGTQKDAYALLERCPKLRSKGRGQDALAYCAEVANRFKGTDAGKDAEIMIDEIKRTG